MSFKAGVKEGGSKKLGRRKDKGGREEKEEALYLIAQVRIALSPANCCSSHPIRRPSLIDICEAADLSILRSIVRVAVAARTKRSQRKGFFFFSSKGGPHNPACLPFIKINRPEFPNYRTRTQWYSSYRRQGVRRGGEGKKKGGGGILLNVGRGGGGGGEEKIKPGARTPR